MVFSEIFIVHHHFAGFRIKDQQNKDHVANTLFSLVHLNFKLFSENQAGLYLVVGGGGAVIAPEIRQSDYNAFISVISDPPRNKRKYISTAPLLKKF